MTAKVIHFAQLDPANPDHFVMTTACGRNSLHVVCSYVGIDVTCKMCRAARSGEKRGPVFTVADKALIHTAAQAVWEYIAYDVIQATAEMNHKDPEEVTVLRSDVMDMVLDADRIEDELRVQMAKWVPEERSRVFHIWEHLDYRAKRRILYGAFHHTRYGL